MKASESILCPAHRCKPGSLLLGVREENGSMSILPQALPIDDAFIARARQHPVPAEQRFRFTNKCIEGGCRQWTGNGCGVVERVLGFIDEIPADAITPRCGITSRCRWYVQRGPEACRICPYVLTEITEAEMAGWEALEFE
jgi:hypothetical protein